MQQIWNCRTSHMLDQCCEPGWNKANCAFLRSSEQALIKLGAQWRHHASCLNRVNSSNEAAVRTTVLQCAGSITGSSRIACEQASGFGGPELGALRNSRYKVKWLQYSQRRKILGKRTVPACAPASITLQPSLCWAMDHWSGYGPCPWPAGLIPGLTSDLAHPTDLPTKALSDPGHCHHGLWLPICLAPSWGSGTDC